MIPFNIIVAIDQNRGIGKEGRLPWNLPGDMKHFKDITTKTTSEDVQNVVIMGRKTWESIPEKFRPLSDRINVVLTRNQSFNVPPEVLKVASLDAVEKCLEGKTYGDVYVIGGEHLFNELINNPACQKLYITHIERSFQCDRHFPSFESRFKLVSKTEPKTENEINYYFAEYVK